MKTIFKLIILNFISLQLFCQADIRFVNDTIIIPRKKYSDNYVIFPFQNIGNKTLEFSKSTNKKGLFLSGTGNVPPNKWGYFCALYTSFSNNTEFESHNIYFNNNSITKTIAWKEDKNKIDTTQINYFRNSFFSGQKNRFICVPYKIKNIALDSVILNIKKQKTGSYFLYYNSKSMNWEKVNSVLLKIGDSTIYIRDKYKDISFHPNDLTDGINYSHGIYFDILQFSNYFHCNPILYGDEFSLTHNYSKIICDSMITGVRDSLKKQIHFRLNLFNKSDIPAIIYYANFSNLKNYLPDNNECTKSILPNSKETFEFTISEFDFKYEFDKNTILELGIIEENLENIRILLK